MTGDQRIRTGLRPPLWCFTGGGAPALSLLPLARGLPPDQSVHALQAAGFEGRAVPDFSVRGAARRHVRQIRQAAPVGPYPLLGHSAGGLVALAAAHELTTSGERVPFVMMLDTPLPPALRAGDPPGIRAGAGAAVPTRRERWRMHRWVASAGLVQYPPAVRDRVFWERSLRMMNRHRPVPYPGRVVLVLAQDNGDDVEHWRSVLTGPFEVLRVPGGHSSILRPPFNAPVLQRLCEELDQAWVGAG